MLIEPRPKIMSSLRRIMITEMETEIIKEGYKSMGEEICSNFDHKINGNVVDRLKREKLIADYPGLNFKGNVWFKDGKYYCAVWQYHVLVETIYGDTFQEVKEKVCDKYGND